MTLDLTGKHCHVIFSAACKNAGFPGPQMRTLLILLFGKTKAFFGNDAARKNGAFSHTLFPENERETSELKKGNMLSVKSKATCKN